MLEHHAALGRRAGHRQAIDQQRAGAGREVAGQGAEQGGLAAAGRAEDADELARRDAEVQPLHGFEGISALPEADGQLPAFDAAGLHGLLEGAHQELLRTRYQGVARPPRRFTRPLLAMPSRPISSMPTTMSG
ncbi:hypothetical protein D9M68_651290 [compost metagenome]